MLRGSIYLPIIFTKHRLWQNMKVTIYSLKGADNSFLLQQNWNISSILRNFNPLLQNKVEKMKNMLHAYLAATQRNDRNQTPWKMIKPQHPSYCTLICMSAYLRKRKGGNNLQQYHATRYSLEYMWRQQKQSMTDGQTDRQTDGRRTKWSLSGALLRWRHKNQLVLQNCFKDYTGKSATYV